MMKVCVREWSFHFQTYEVEKGTQMDVVRKYLFGSKGGLSRGTGRENQEELGEEKTRGVGKNKVGEQSSKQTEGQRGNIEVDGGAE